MMRYAIPTFLRECQDSWQYKAPKFLYRASSFESAGSTSRDELCCGAWSGTPYQTSFLHQWLYEAPEDHLAEHFNGGSQHPSLFISTTSELLRAIQIACNLFRKGHHDVRISIISVEAARHESHHDMTNARAVARSLGLPNDIYYKNEWLFSGRIKSPAIVYQLRMDAATNGRMRQIFPSLHFSSSLRILRDRIIQDFGNKDPNICGSNQAADDGRRCAFLAGCFNFTSDEVMLYCLIVEEVRRWKCINFEPDQQYYTQFYSIAGLYAPSQ